jgi:hypothetical protein
MLHYNIFIFETTTFWTNEVVTKIFEPAFGGFVMHVTTYLAHILLFHSILLLKNYIIAVYMVLFNSICL